MYELKIKEKLNKKFLKILKKNPPILKIINKKVFEIRSNPNRYKNLRSPLNHLKRVHIDHHDKIYK